MLVQAYLAAEDDAVHNQWMPPRPPAASPAAASPARRTQATRSAATRDALISAARRLFAEQGFADVPTDAIVTAAGVTRGALYHQFADKTALFDAVVESVESDVARRLVESVLTAGITDPVEAMRHTMTVWLDICVEPEIHRIALVDGPSVLGWSRWREVCRQYVFGLVEAALTSCIEAGRIRPQPTRPLAHVLMGAGDEAALYVAEAPPPDRPQARTDMLTIFDHLLASLTA